MKKGPKRYILGKYLKMRFPDLPTKLAFVLIGTTGTCNASCIHCPTGKARTAGSPRQPMDMRLFKKLIDGIDNLPMKPPTHIGFGLFGDGLVDPYVVERMRYSRDRIPHGHFVINTNGAAFSAARHAELNGLVNLVTLHCESLVAETYDYLMQPLRAKNVFPKYRALIETFHGKVHVSVPISRLNIDQAAEIREQFLNWGASTVHFDPLASRCEPDPVLFRELSLDPFPIRCGPDVLDNLIIDCDGQVLVCCQDFAREESIGSLQDQSLLKLLTNHRRRLVRRRFSEGAHEEMATCSRCFGDLRTENFPFDVSLSPHMPADS